jgi:hypothetical protein
MRHSFHSTHLQLLTRRADDPEKKFKVEFLAEQAALRERGEGLRVERRTNGTGTDGRTTVGTEIRLDSALLSPRPSANSAVSSVRRRYAKNRESLAKRPESDRFSFHELFVAFDAFVVAYASH